MKTFIIGNSTNAMQISSLKSSLNFVHKCLGLDGENVVQMMPNNARIYLTTEHPRGFMLRKRIISTPTLSDNSICGTLESYEF